MARAQGECPGGLPEASVLRPDEMVAEQGWQGRHGGHSGQREAAEQRDEVLGHIGRHTVQFCRRMTGKGEWSGQQSLVEAGGGQEFTQGVTSAMPQTVP